MKAIIVTVCMLAALAFAAGPRTNSVTSTGGTGIDPASATAGVGLAEAQGIRVRVSTVTGTLTGGGLCAYYLPNDGGASGWTRNKGLDLTVPSVTRADGGTVTAVTLPDFAVMGAYGRASWVACGLTGTATDGGTNSYTVTTEAYGPQFP